VGRNQKEKNERKKGWGNAKRGLGDFSRRLHIEDPKRGFGGVGKGGSEAKQAVNGYLKDAAVGSTSPRCRMRR